MLATPTPVPGQLPVGQGWAYEVKWDGMRVLASAGERYRLTSRVENDVTVSYPELAGLADLPDAILDGEVVALDANGIPSFAALADRMHVREGRRARALSRSNPVTFMAFDVLRLHGVDITGRSFDERRATLERLDLPPCATLSPLFTDGPTLLTATAEQGLEGAMAKRCASVYRPGQRSRDWVKAPHHRTRTVLVGGWRPQKDTTRTVGALLVGAPDGEGNLRYLGRVGSGIGRTAQGDLARLLEPLHTDASPFGEPVPAVDAAGATWCAPQVVVEVRHLGLSGAGRLRQPAYRGMRRDAAADVLG
jgi:bifunctional non-homologous end joining protein LigD